MHKMLSFPTTDNVSIHIWINYSTILTIKTYGKDYCDLNNAVINL